jgi:hypothetical protein
MPTKLTTGATLLLALIGLLSTGCRSAKSTLPPDNVLAQYAPRGVQAGAEYTAFQTRDLVGADHPEDLAAGRDHRAARPAAVPTKQQTRYLDNSGRAVTAGAHHGNDGQSYRPPVELRRTLRQGQRIWVGQGHNCPGVESRESVWASPLQSSFT